MSGKNSPTKQKRRQERSHSQYVKGAIWAVDAVFNAAERLKLTDEETLSLVRTYRARLKMMEKSGDTAAPFLDRAVAASLKEITTPVESQTA